MINLLPDSHKSEVRAGRTNVVLVRYVFITLSAVLVLAILLTGPYVVLNTTKAAAETKVAENNQKVLAYQTTKTQADAFRADLVTAKSVLDNELSYTRLIYNIANTVPRGVILDDLSLDPKNFGSNATMNANARTFDNATQLKEAFSRRSDIFSNVQFQRLEYSGAGTGDATYPVKVTISVVINKDALK